MLSGDEHYKAPAGDSFSLPELSHGELSLLLASSTPAPSTRTCRSATCTRFSSPPTSTTSRFCGGPARRGWRRAWSPGTRCGRWRWPT